MRAHEDHAVSRRSETPAHATHPLYPERSIIVTTDHTREAQRVLASNRLADLIQTAAGDWIPFDKLYAVADAILESDWLAAHDAALVEGRDAENEATQRRWEDWLFATNWPFDWTTPTNQPPTTAERMGRIWNERDNWRITDDEAADCIADESGLAVTDGGDTDG